MRSLSVLVVACALTGLGSATALADEPALELTIKDHRFEPAELKVPANTRTVINVKNADATPEEFESSELKIEKIIPGNATGVVRLRPLAPGRYEFVGEYHEDTAKGTIVVE